MISRTESCQNWLETIMFQMQNMDYSQQAAYLAGFDFYFSVLIFRSITFYACQHRPIALLKMQTTRFAQDTARDAVQVGSCPLW